MNDHPQTCISVHGGTYGTIAISQHSQLEDGVRFRTMLVTSELEADEINGDELIVANGAVRCTGDVTVPTISGRGQLDIGGNIVCNQMTFTGTVHCEGDIRCNGTLSVNGSLKNAQHISAQTVHLNGVLHGRDIAGQELEVQPLRSQMFSRFNMNEYESGRSAATINASTVRARGLTCRLMHADSVTLREGSTVEHATCTISLGTDRTSSVLLMGHNCRRVHLKTA
ncbi:hypothetical protein [Bifidobacterium scaligerum]|uniref:DUF342 domain-containing protein n=1 Tax=Bifidobacterium scaligerum TaxID=2052656 RepID=A0A2M9HQT8_9BIFI|nr:hypothetical protein [Bifidobacterium scaligerum]PJM79180.1 hypothetical protein CUU80_03740 [Bifidobacterium scaligerum]